MNYKRCIELQIQILKMMKCPERRINELLNKYKGKELFWKLFELDQKLFEKEQKAEIEEFYRKHDYKQVERELREFDEAFKDVIL